MKPIKNEIALSALTKAIEKTEKPAPTKHNLHRMVDKFVIRGDKALFSELAVMAKANHRSSNSEVIAAITAAMDGFSRSKAILNILECHVGAELAGQIRSNLMSCDHAGRAELFNFVARFPTNLRGTIAQVAASRSSAISEGRKLTMNGWVLIAINQWVEIHRLHDALLREAIKMGSNS